MIKQHLLWIMLFFPFLLFSQKYKPSDFYGRVTYIDEKSVDYTSLSDSAGRTQIPFFRNLPSDNGIPSTRKPEMLPLQWVDRIKFVRTSEEGEEDQADIDLDDGGVYGLQKVKITYNTNPGSFPEIVYLAIPKLRWMNSNIKEFSNGMDASLWYLDSITIHVNKK